eukprot:7233422-Lingulodinium_polyedra.AAC.1
MDTSAAAAAPVKHARTHVHAAVRRQLLPAGHGGRAACVRAEKREAREEAEVRAESLRGTRTGRSCQPHGIWKLTSIASGRLRSTSAA